jgi:glycosyltransferase involved in cell wall biosynthesis
LRLALLNPCYWPEVRRGSERLAHDLMRGLDPDRFHARLITSHRGLPRRSTEDGVRITRHPRPPEALVPRRWRQPHLTHVPLAYLTLVGGSFDIAHALYPTDALAAMRWSRKRDRPAVFSAMGIPPRGIAGHRLATVRRALEEPAATIALSRAAATAISARFDVEPTVIYPGVDCEAFTPGGRRAGQPTILCAASIEEPRKRVGLLVEAFSILRRRLPEARLMLVRRPGTPRSAIEAATVPGVEWILADEGAALRDAYRASWISVLPSVEEAFGLVVVESLACGTPVLATAGGGPDEILDARVGGLFDSEDPAAISAQLESAIGLHSEAGVPEACRERAERFSISACVLKHRRLYEALCR